MYWHRQSLHAGPNSNLRFFHQGLQFGFRFGFEPSIFCSRRNRIQILPYQWLEFEDGPRTVEQADDVPRQNRGRRYASLPAAFAWSTMEEIEAKAQKRTADGKRKPKDAQERRSDLLNSPKRRGSMRMKVTSQLDKKGCDCWARLKQGREGFELH